MFILAHNFQLHALAMPQYSVVAAFRCQDDALQGLKQTALCMPESIKSLTVRRIRCLEDESEADDGMTSSPDRVFVVVELTQDAPGRRVYRYLGYFHSKNSGEAYTRALQARQDVAASYFLVTTVVEAPPVMVVTV